MQLPVSYSKTPTRERRLVREEYTRLQGGKCWYCQTSLEDAPDQGVLSKRINLRLFPPNFFKYPVHLHHDHETDLTIGAVHNTCNAVLWQYHEQ